MKTILAFALESIVTASGSEKMTRILLLDEHAEKETDTPKLGTIKLGTVNSSSNYRVT
jgi:hypothetical protein